MSKTGELFGTFFKIGAFTFGGGYAMVALLEHEFVEKKRWLTREEFLDMVAIAESTPGPVAVNSATYIGYKLAGVAGAAASTLAVCLPSFAVIYLISLFFDRFLQLTVVYAKAFRRGDGFYPQNAIFQDLVLLCIVWQGIDWLREKKFAKGIGAIAAVLCWPYVVVVFLLLFPGVQEMPIASTIVAFVITSPLPMWTTITDGGWSFLLGGVLLYALRGRRKVQLTVWALVIFLCDFVLTFGMACRQDGFVWTQMFTDYYEWFEVAAVLLMLLYNGQRGKGHKQLFYWFYPAHVYLLYGASCLVYNVLR